MATEIRFYLNNEYVERLFAIKEDEKKYNLTGNEFARELLERYIKKLHPDRVYYDDDTGERIR